MPTPKITGIIGVSCSEQSRWAAFHATLAGMWRPDGSILSYAMGAEISVNRNKITQAALELGAEWVLYLDDDQILRPDTLQRLLAADCDVISALYLQRKPPFKPVLMQGNVAESKAALWKQLGSQETGVVEVTAAGAGCLLVRSKVLAAMEQPWWTLGQIHPTTWGDDLDFCRRVREAGFSIHCDLDNTIGHITTGVIWPSHSPDEGWKANFAPDPKSTGPIASWPLEIANY